MPVLQKALHRQLIGAHFQSCPLSVFKACHCRRIRYNMGKQLVQVTLTYSRSAVFTPGMQQRMHATSNTGAGTRVPSCKRCRLLYQMHSFRRQEYWRLQLAQGSMSRTLQQTCQMQHFSLQSWSRMRLTGVHQ